MGNSIILNKQQQEAAELIEKWYYKDNREKQFFILAGYAGTGKTFLVNYIINHILNISDEVVFLAPTGKAASVLLQRGAGEAMTIHKLIYNRTEKTYKSIVDGKEVVSKKTVFVKKDSIPKYKLIIVDEISMVDKEVFEDLLSFGVRLLCCGDVGQLPAISKSHDLLDHPDYNLTEIVRQKEEDMIVKLATKARNGEPIEVGNYGNCLVLTQNDVSPEFMKYILTNADQVIAGTNKTCSIINQEMRSYYGWNDNSLHVGEKVICLCNNWDLEFEEGYSLVNGLIGDVTAVEIINEKENIGKMSFKVDFLESELENVPFDNNIFSDGKFLREFHQKMYYFEDGHVEAQKVVLGKKPDESRFDYRKRMAEFLKMKNSVVRTEEINFFNYAYCISCHKSQGSEWNNVVVFDESEIFQESNKWLYTAITRAKENLIIIK